MPKASHDQLRPVLEALQRRFGTQGLRKLGNLPASTALSSIPTGFIELDEALSWGGIPRGYITELVGVPTSGMATLALKVVANAQAVGDVAAFIDLERTFDPAYAARCGVNAADLLLVHGPSRGHALDVAHDLVVSRAVGVMVFHSIEALLAEGERPSTITGGLRGLQRALGGSGCALIFLTPHEAGAPPPGADGTASTLLGYVAGLRLLVKREAWLNDGHDVRGYQARVRVLRSRFGPEGREISIEITFDGVVDGDGA